MPIIVDDVGTEIVLVVEEDGQPLDISTATAITYEFTAPDGIVTTKNAAFLTDGVDGKLVYTTASGDIDQVGVWKVRAAFTLGTWTGRTRQVALRVES